MYVASWKENKMTARKYKRLRKQFDLLVEKHRQLIRSTNDLHDRYFKETDVETKDSIAEKMMAKTNKATAIYERIESLHGIISAEQDRIIERLHRRILVSKLYNNGVIS